MHSPDAPLFDFHHILQALAGLSERQQITSLKFELFHAIERASDFRAHSLELEQTVAELRAEWAMRDREHAAVTTRLRAECAQSVRELESLKNDQDRRTRTLRLELVAAELVCEALEETCRALLVTVEHAARSAGDGDAPPPHASELSA